MKAYVIYSEKSNSSPIKVFLSADKAKEFLDKLNEVLKIRYSAEDAALRIAKALPKGQNNIKFDEVFYLSRTMFLSKMTEEQKILNGLYPNYLGKVLMARVDFEE